MEIKPKILYIRVSENCNSHCFMCHYAGKSNTYNITMEQYDKLLKYAKREDIKIIRFTGGEPLLHNEITAFLKKAKQNGFMTSIITNGYLLPQFVDKLLGCHLDQCIISLDGSCSEVHDEVRNFPGCFNNVIDGINKLKESDSKMIIRINTVVSGKNISDISNLYRLLLSLKIDQWSIIPVKLKDNTWNENSINFYNKFLENIKNNDDDKFHFLGDSKNFAGKTNKDINNTFSNIRLRSKNKCSVVDYIRFYIPDKDLLVPCNCVAHRIQQIPIVLSGNLEEDCENIRKWLKKHCNECNGCEPLNIYINDHPDIMLEDKINY